MGFYVKQQVQGSGVLGGVADQPGPDRVGDESEATAAHRQRFKPWNLSNFLSFF